MFYYNLRCYCGYAANRQCYSVKRVECMDLPDGAASLTKGGHLLYYFPKCCKDADLTYYACGFIGLWMW